MAEQPRPECKKTIAKEKINMYPSQQPQILLIHADETVHSILQDIFTVYHYRIVCATEGATGLQLLAAAQPNLVMLGSTLPDMSSCTLCSQIRRQRQIPVLFFAWPMHQTDKAQPSSCALKHSAFRTSHPNQAVTRIQAILQHSWLCAQDYKQK